MDGTARASTSPAALTAIKQAFVRRRDALEITLVLAACVFIWIWRRPEQLTRPYVWVEESQIIRNFLEDGWAGAFEPIQGYLELPAGVLVSLATQISFVHLPGLMYAFALGMFIATVLLLLLPESIYGGLRTRSIMALTMTLVPTNPEVFGVLLYSFWWSTLWPLIILGWRRDLWALRAPLLLVGALSSPAGGALFVVFAIVYLRRRRLRELICAGILLAGFIFQAVLAMDSSRAELLSRDASPMEVLEQTFRIGGFFEARWLSPGAVDTNLMLVAGVAFLAFLLVAGIHVSLAVNHDAALILVLAAGVFTVLSAVPAPLVSDPVIGGPRYFFLPFVVFGWALIAVWRYTNADGLRVAAVALLCISLFGLGTTFSRTFSTKTARLSWADEVRKCATSRSRVARIPIYFDGGTSLFRSLELSPAQCRRLVE